MNAISQYVKELQKHLATGESTEHTYRPALKTLIESLGKGIIAINEPKRAACGAPDFEVKLPGRYGPLTIGHIEAKNLDVDLNSIESDSNRKNPQTRNGEQLSRYRNALTNLILTNHLEFRWYVRREKRLEARLATIPSSGKIKAQPGADAEVSQLLELFLEQEPEPVADPKELALRMANLTHLIRDIIVEAFQTGNASTTLTDLHKAFEETLIPELEKCAFADMFAQTLAYGLFAARCTDPSIRPGQFTRDKAAHLIPKTNPFLRKLFSMIAGLEMDEEPYEGLVNDLAQLLGYAEMDKVLANFGKREKKQDPVLHFYETFLAAYNPAERKRRGVYYTPEPVVSYIARSVDYLLKTRFNCPDGLAETSTIEWQGEDEKGNKTKEKAPRVLILDPACGTGTFLYAIVDLIRDKFMHQGRAGEWSGYVRDHLLPRLFGFELLMAPYAVAHFKLGMQLAALDLPSDELRRQWAYDFHGDERLGVYLTNTLEQAARKSEMLFARFITEESEQAARIKRDIPIMVVLGNPPYAGISANRSWEVAPNGKRVRTFIGRLLRDYYFVDGQPLGERKVWLQDDYVKFMRFGQWRIERTGAGILAFITNHSYLDNPTFRGMRQQLTRTFDQIYVLDLHGNKKKKEVCPDGSRDDNVFEIQQGVAISIFVKFPPKTRARERPNAPPLTAGLRPTTQSDVRHADLWGLEKEKRRWLDRRSLADTPMKSISPSAPFYFFIPQRASLDSEYDAAVRITQVFALATTGIVTARDAFVTDFEDGPIEERMRIFLDPALGDEEVKSRLALSENYAWRVGRARSELSAVKDPAHHLTDVLYRPFDARRILYHPSVVWRTRKGVMSHMLGGSNIAMCVGRAAHVIGPGQWNIVFCSRWLTDFNLFYRGGNVNFPLYLNALAANGGYNKLAVLLPTGPWESATHPNLDREFAAQMERMLGLKSAPHGLGDLKNTLGPEGIFHYIYAIFHSPTYRERYAEFLKRDFPRVPLTSNLPLFRELCHKGADLVAFHLIEENYAAASWNRSQPRKPSPFGQPITRFAPKGDGIVEKVFYVAPGEPETGTGKPLPPRGGRVYISKDKPKETKKGQYFEGVPPEVWEFHVGGYQVCHKWLKDRKGRKLSYDDIQHYHKIVVALNETIRLMAEIDHLIDAHGGWPIQ